MKALIFGCGYLGRRVAGQWLEAGHEVSALTRSTAKRTELKTAGITPIVGDVIAPESLSTLPAADVVLYAVGYDRSDGADRRTVVLDGLRNALAALAGRTERLVYISTTSVYGQSNGEWIDEESPTEPLTESGRLALAAEQLVASQSALLDLRSSILRLSGLYGPGRMLRRLEQLRSGAPIEGNGDAWLNLIHVDDAASAVLFAAERLLDSHADPDVYLVTDDRPVRRRDYYGRPAELTGSPQPVFDPTIESRSAGLGKRCRNVRAKRDLGLTLAFPTFEEGLADAVIRIP